MSIDRESLAKLIRDCELTEADRARIGEIVEAARKRSMTREEFETAYVRRLNSSSNGELTMGELRNLGYRAEPCACGEEWCEGWVMERDLVADPWD